LGHLNELLKHFWNSVNYNSLMYLYLKTFGAVLPQISVVQNGYISIVAYQNKGYALLPMD